MKTTAQYKRLLQDNGFRVEIERHPDAHGLYHIAIDDGTMHTTNAYRGNWSSLKCAYENLVVNADNNITVMTKAERA